MGLYTLSVQSLPFLIFLKIRDFYYSVCTLVFSRRLKILGGSVGAVRGFHVFICQRGLCWFFFFARFAKRDDESSDEAHEDESDGDESYRFLID